MADTWVTWSEFQTAHPNAVQTETEFNQLAAQAAMTIEDGTHWRAAIADEPADITALAKCQSQLIVGYAQVAAVDARTGDGRVTSAGNDGYTESYASAADIRAERDRSQQEILRRTLGGPETGWMLYQGGVYHRLARR